MNKLNYILMVFLLILLSSCMSMEEEALRSSDFKAYKNSVVLKKYETLGLPKKYTIDEAVKNGDATLGPDRKQYNMERVKSFVDNVNNKISDRVRYTFLTDEGDAIIIDLLYDGETILFVQDSTRDNFGTKEVRQYRLTNIESEEDGYKLFVDEELLFIIPILKDVDES